LDAVTCPPSPARTGTGRDPHRHSPDTLAHFVLRSILGALRDWGLGTDPLDRDQALDLAVTLVLDALARRDDG
jgi:hypothetical protein